MFWKKPTTYQPTVNEFNDALQRIDVLEQAQKELHKEHAVEVKQIKHDHELNIAKINSSHSIALKEKEFELKHFKDDEIKAAQEIAADMTQKNAVLENENKMLREITNLNADIIDIKDLVSSLIKKLPDIKLTSLTVQNTDK